jgi:hypothetical protein
MADIFTLDNVQDFSEKINLDELYEKKKQHDLSRLELYNKILNRIHVKIKTISRQKLRFIKSERFLCKCVNSHPWSKYRLIYL